VATAPDFALTVEETTLSSFDLTRLDQGLVDGVGSTTVLLDDIPSYEWIYSCEVIAFGSVLAYWDLQGYANLFDAEGWDDISITENLWREMATPEHFDKYTRDPDVAELPEPPDESLADFIQTGEGINIYPNSANFDPLHEAMPNYAAHRGYDFDVLLDNRYEGMDAAMVETLWDVWTAEIDAGRPVVFRYPEHSRPVFGYAETADGQKWYAAYDHSSTKSVVYGETEHAVWYRFEKTYGPLAEILDATYFGPDGSLDHIVVA
jgi:hypothetical protein